MKAIQIVQETGPDSALREAELQAPTAASPLPPHLSGGGTRADAKGDGEGANEAVVIEVRAAGVSFPELLQTRGLYQLKPPLPFVPGSEVAGIVREAPPQASVSPGERAIAFCGLGGFAEVALAPARLCFRLPDELDFAQGASLVLNYHTAYFALVLRGRLTAGESVLVHGGGGGVGTAALQVARGLGAKTIAVVSSERKREVALEAGAEHVLYSDGPWKDEARELTSGGVDIVLDPVGGGERFTDSLRSLRPGGRAVVVGFTAGEIPQVRVNRLLLGNTEVIGAGWGAFALSNPAASEQIAKALERLIAQGTVKPIVGARFPLTQAADALKLLEARKAVGKVVLEI